MVCKIFASVFASETEKYIVFPSLERGRGRCGWKKSHEGNGLAKTVRLQIHEIASLKNKNHPEKSVI